MRAKGSEDVGNEKIFHRNFTRWKEYSFFEPNSVTCFLIFFDFTRELFALRILGKKKKKESDHPVVMRGIRIRNGRKNGERVGYFLSRHLVCTGTKLHTCVQSVTHTHVMLYAHQVTVNLQSFSSCRDRVQCGLLWFSKSW